MKVIAHVDSLTDTGGPLAEPVAGRGERRGLLVRLREAGGALGIGEASPLPGYSPDTIDEARAELAATSRFVLDLDRPLVEQLGAAGSAVAAPAARFALETALLDLASRKSGRPMHALVGAEPAGAVPLCALIPPGPEALARARAAGTACFKVKVGREPAVGLSLLRDLRADRGPVALRADANQAWSVDAARAHLAELAGLDVELCEEPVAAGELAELAGSPVPLAADESLTRPDAEDYLTDAARAGLISIAVLKPALLGGFSRCLSLANAARRAGADVLVTHMFDGPVALAAASELALALAPERACGLAAHDALAAYPKTELPHLRSADGTVRPHGRTGLGVP